MATVKIECCSDVQGGTFTKPNARPLEEGIWVCLGCGCQWLWEVDVDPDGEVVMDQAIDACRVGHSL